jgi:phosphopantothenoylcysteine decarboxylase|tara:strand:- start:125 stop:670 length:546 start_codon:yes stop_codon:yes gene_type:complete
MSDSRRAVVLAVGGGIAAYKSAFLCSRLVQSGCEVRVALTRSARNFVGTSTFAALSGKSVATEVFDPEEHPLGSHIELAAGCDLMIVAPATASLLSKFALGQADDLISTLYLQLGSPVLVAPAMSESMWSKAAVQRNVQRLREDGCHFVGPSSGWLSCRASGEGRMSEPDEILAAAEALFN